MRYVFRRPHDYKSRISSPSILFPLAGTDIPKSVSDPISFVSTGVGYREISESLSDPISFVSTAERVLDLNRALSDPISFVSTAQGVLDLNRALSDTLSLVDLVENLSTLSLPPLVFDTSVGKIRRLDENNKLLLYPEPLTFTYSGNKVITITNRVGTKTLTYSGGNVATISDTETGKVSTFTYSAGKLVSITISDI